MSDTELAEILALAVGAGEKAGKPKELGLRPVWATVTAVTPTIEVRRDGETGSVIVTASAELPEQLEITDRVLCWQYESQLILVKKRARSLSIWDTPRIPAGSNLNSYTTPGQWYNPLNVEVAGFTNGPPSNAAGTLVVMRATGEPGGEAGVTQLWYGYDYQGTGSRIYRRRLYNTSWSSWKLMNPASWVGSVSGGQRSGVTFYNVTLNFPSGLFSTAPKVFAQVNSQAGGGAQLQVMTGNITASSCLVGFFMTTGTMNNHWCEADVFAVEPS